MDVEAQKGPPWWASMLSVAAGYFGACIVGALSFLSAMSILDMITGRGFTFDSTWQKVFDFIGASVWISMAMLSVCLPGFMILRLFLFLLKRHDPYSFAIAGALLPLIIIGFLGISNGSLIPLPFTMILSFVGALAGGVCFFIESLFQSWFRRMFIAKSRSPAQVP